MLKILRTVVVWVLMLAVISLLALIYLVKMPVFTTSIEDESATFVNSDTLETHVKKLSQEYLPRTCTQADNLKRAANYIKDEFEQWNPNTLFQPYQVDDDNFVNVVSEYGPDTDDIIIVGAHYDAYMPLPGADDNASGVAGLLELNRLLSSAELSRRVVLVAYSCEEPPFYASGGMGSVIHAKSVEGKTVELMISLEMIGYFSDKENSQDFPVPGLSLLYPNQGDFVAVGGEMFSFEASKLKATINRVTDIDAYSINAPKSIQGIDFSDHRSYWAQDYPAIMVTDTAFYRNKNYHTPEDTFDKLNYDKMAKVVYGVYAYVLELAGHDQHL